MVQRSFGLVSLAAPLLALSVACGGTADAPAAPAAGEEATSTGQTLTFPDFTAVQWIAPFDDITPDDVIGAMNEYAVNAGLPWRSGTADYALLTAAFTGLAASANHDSELQILPGPSLRSGLGPAGWGAFVERQEFRDFLRQEPITLRIGANGKGERVVADTHTLANTLHAITRSGGFTPIAGQHLAADGNVDVYDDHVILDGARAIGVERHVQISSRLGAEGRAVNEVLTSFGTPRIWLDLDYRVFVDGSYEIAATASHVPSAAFFVGKNFQVLRKQTASDFGKFMFTGEDAPAASGLTRVFTGQVR